MPLWVCGAWNGSVETVDVGIDEKFDVCVDTTLGVSNGVGVNVDVEPHAVKRKT